MRVMLFSSQMLYLGHNFRELNRFLDRGNQKSASENTKQIWNSLFLYKYLISNLVEFHKVSKSTISHLSLFYDSLRKYTFISGK